MPTTRPLFSPLSNTQRSPSLIAALLLTLLAPGLACGVEDRDLPVIEPQLDTSPRVTDESEVAASTSLRHDVVTLNADRTMAAVVRLEIDDLSALPVGEGIDVSPGSTVRASLMATGVIPVQHPACQLVDNPLPDEVNPCVDAVTLRAVRQPVSLTGVLVMTVNDDIVSGQLSAFQGDDDALYGNFTSCLREDDCGRVVVPAPGGR